MSVNYQLTMRIKNMGISGFSIVSGNDVQIVKDIKKAGGIK